MKKKVSRKLNNLSRIFLSVGLTIGYFEFPSAFAAQIGAAPELRRSDLNNSRTVVYQAALNSIGVAADPVVVLFPPPILDIPIGGSQRGNSRIELDESANLVGEKPGNGSLITGQRAQRGTDFPATRFKNVADSGEEGFQFLLMDGAFSPLLADKDFGVKANITGALKENITATAKGSAGSDQKPCIEVLNEVSLDGGSTFFDANASDTGPVSRVTASAEFRIKVTNCGSVDLDNVRVEDQTLGINEVLEGSLSVNETRVLDKDDIPALGLIAPICDSPDEVFTIAGASAESRTGGAPVHDSDPAVVVCAGEPCIDVLTELSVDGGENFFDANDGSTVATTMIIGGNAKYRLTVSNCGTVDLVDVTINDRELGIVDYPVGKLPVNGKRVLAGVDVGVLETSGRCKMPGKFVNMATVKAKADPGEPQAKGVDPNVTDIDPAILICESEFPRINILTEVSVDSGQTYFDANQRPDAPETAMGHSPVLYRLTVSNPGPIDLVDVVVNDADLGVADFSIGDLAVNRSVVLSAGKIPKLRQRIPCKVPGVVNNIAKAMGASANDPDQKVMDSDPAVVICSRNEMDRKVRSMATMVPWLWLLRPAILINK